jgi:predicted transcriptional regulator
LDDLATPTPRELEILKILWELGPSSVRAVHRRLLADEPELAYNTIQTMLRVMEGKGLVGHDRQGRTFIYTARFTRDQSTARFLDRVFDGAASELVQSLLRSERVSASELEQIHGLIAAARRKNGGR